MKKFLCIGIGLGVAQAFFAQESHGNIEEIEVYGKFLNTPYQKINENIEIITADEIKNTPARSIDELLQQYAGVDIRRRGANGVQADVSIRGSSFEQVLVLINGIRMNDSQTGHNSLNIPVDLSNVDRIEIIKGPAARRFGQNAYAGVINIITKPEKTDSAKISAEGGDYATYNLGLSANFGSERFRNLLQVNSGASDGYRYNTDYTIRNIFYQNTYRINNGDIGLQAGFSGKKFGANGFYSSPEATEQYEELQASVVALTHRQNFGKLGISSNIYWRRGQDLYLYNRQKPEIYRNMHIGNNLGGEVNGSYRSALGTTGIGLELRKEFLASNNLGQRERFMTQLFLEHHFALISGRLQVSPGISWADYSGEGNFFYPGIDVGFEVNRYHKIYGNLAKVHRIPTFTDLYYISKTEEGNPDLLPENAWSGELGYLFKSKATNAKFSGFVRRSENAIDWIRENPGSIWKAYNIGTINMKGFEAEVRQQFFPWMQASVAYSFIDMDYKNEGNLISKYVFENLKHQFIARTELSFLKNFTNELSYRYTERAVTGSYNLLDEKLAYAQHRLQIYLLINNLTNADYTEAFGVPMPGRWFHLGFSYAIPLGKK